MKESNFFISKYVFLIIQALVFVTGALFSYNNYKILAFLVFALLAICSYGFYYVKTKNIIYLPSIYSLAWIGGISLSCLKLSKLQMHWEILTWISFGLAYIVFILVYLLLEDRLKINHSKLQCSLDYNSKAKVLNAMIAIDVISLVGMIIEWIKCGFLPILSEKPHAYSYFHVSGIHYFTVLFVLVPALSIVYIMADDNKENIFTKFLYLTIKEKVMIVVLDFIAIFISMAIVSRFQMLFSILLALVTYIYFNHDIKLRYILIVFASLALLWIVLSIFRHHSASYLNEIFEFKNANTPVWITQPYTYICNNYDNFNLMVKNFLIDSSLSHTYGLRMIFPIIALTGLKFINPSLVVGKVFTTKTELTTITLFYDAFYDFGILGIVLFSAIIAILGAFISYRIYKKNNPASIMLGSQFSLYILLSFFTTWFSNPATWFYFVVTVFLGFYITKQVKLH